VVDRIIEEPAGGAHQDLPAAARGIDAAIADALRELLQKTPAELVEDRYKRFRSLGAFVA
jgi:acetyl-CoA carboxylase carboxyl transferase subunit alpha